LRGQDVGRGALVGGVSGGVAGGVTSGLTDTSIGDVEAQEGGFYGQEGVAGTSTGLSPELARFIGSGAGRTAAQLTAQNLAPSQTGTQAPPPTGQVSTPPPSGDVTTTGQPAPGSSALAQALRAGSPVIGGGDGETSARPVWNIASLRVKDETGS
jgi:predicted lipid-binding transport protein (Tim44 family)